MLKRLLAIIGVVCLALAAWPAWAENSGGQRLGTGVPTTLAVSPDGATLAVGTSVGVWFLSAGSLAPLGFWDAGAWVQAVAYSADGRFVRAGERFYDTSTGAATPLVPADLAWQSPAAAHDCAPDGKHCLVYQLDNLIVRDSDTLIDSALLRTGLLFGAAWSPDSGTIYAVAGGGVQAWEAASGKLRQSQTNFFNGSLDGVRWSADSARVGSGQMAWDIQSGQPTEAIAPSAVDSTAPCALPDWWRCGNYEMRIYDQGACVCRWRDLIPHDVGLIAAAYSLDGARLVTSGLDNYTYKCPAGTVDEVAPGQCQTDVASTRIWDLKSLKLLAQLPVRLQTLAFSPNGMLIAGRTFQGLEAWDWASGQRLGSIDLSSKANDYGDVAMSSNGIFIAAASSLPDRTDVTLWRVDTGTQVATLTGHTQPTPWPTGRLGNAYGVLWPNRLYLTGLAFSPDGKHLAASSEDGTVMVWEVEG